VLINKDSKNILKIHTYNPSETKLLGEILGNSLNAGTIVELDGNLGAGKTVLVKGIARGLDIYEEPNSPTFVILSTYEGNKDLYHFDLYRLSTISELEDLNYLDYFYNEGITVVEWAERIKEAFPENTLKIRIEIPFERSEKNLDKRIITIKGDIKWLLSFKNTVEQALQI